MHPLKLALSVCPAVASTSPSCPAVRDGGGRRGVWLFSNPPPLSPPLPSLCPTHGCHAAQVRLEKSGSGALLGARLGSKGSAWVSRPACVCAPPRKELVGVTGGRLGRTAPHLSHFLLLPEVAAPHLGQLVWLASTRGCILRVSGLVRAEALVLDVRGRGVVTEDGRRGGGGRWASGQLYIQVGVG